VSRPRRPEAGLQVQSRQIRGLRRLVYFLLEILFWGSLSLVAYTYALYPLLILRLGKAASRNDVAPSPLGNEALPSVTVIVAAYNEEIHIAARIQNLLQQDYPPERMKIIVGSDGSTDRTVAIAQQYLDARLHVLAFPVNRGKASVLNDCVAQAASEILVFTDANTVFRPDTVRMLVSALDDSTAATCGDLIMAPPHQGQNVDHQYWSIERRLKAAESAIGGLIGANGGVYAIRRAHYGPLRPDTIVDDFVIAMNIGVAGHGIKYVPAAVAFEDTPGDIIEEYYRRVRIGIGNYQALFRHPQYLFAGPWALRFTYLSHKVLRWLTPHLLVCALASSVALIYFDRDYAFVAAIEVLGYSGAALVFFTRQSVSWPKLFVAGMFFAVLNWAFLVGFKRYLFADYRGSWRRTARTRLP
ncbi:MAG: glycosyltransferase family 2 protein, partial [Phycisphaerae bacterium]|nr:glycosyltransferase family 2 protein [Gemmatimonadaceae bacterium]